MRCRVSGERQEEWRRCRLCVSVCESFSREE